jgi:hypothetical protein
MLYCLTGVYGAKAMTAEIAIINKTAVALAADSKVTLTVGGKQKTYDTVDKIFSLSKTEPIGAMIYGSADFMGFPWERVLKEYRRKLPLKRFSTVFDWADDLLKFLVNFFPFGEVDDENLVRRIGSTAVEQVVGRYFEFLRKGVATDEIGRGLEDEVDQHIAELELERDFITDAEWVQISGRLEKTLTEVSANGYLQGFESIQPKLRKLAELSVRKHVSSPAHTGLVVTGFGENELLPSLVAFEIDGVLASKIKSVEHSKFDATRSNHGLIQPFAQSDMVHRFMEGVDPDYAVQLNENMRQLMTRTIEDTARALGHDDNEILELSPAFKAAASASLEEFWSANNKLKWDRFTQPILDMTMSLPKDVLAHLAEALVSLTSLQRRVSRDIETVGGAIDVAVISKGDGFVWIKRKHYFSPDRNLRFVNGYFSEYGSEKSNGGDK